MNGQLPPLSHLFLVIALCLPVCIETCGVLCAAQVRSALIEMLDAWVSVAPADQPFEELVEILPSPKCVSEGMQAGITWMASVYSAGKGTSSDCIAQAAKAVAIGASYKTVPVREAAGQLLEAMIALVGLGDVQQAVDSLDKSSQKAVAEALAKAGISAAAAAAAVPSSRPSTAGNARGTTAGSRPGTAGSRAAAGGTGTSRPGTAASVGGRSVAGSTTSLAGTLRGSTALAAALGTDEGPLLGVDKNKEERAKKVCPGSFDVQVICFASTSGISVTSLSSVAAYQAFAGVLASLTPTTEDYIAKGHECV